VAVVLAVLGGIAGLIVIEEFGITLAIWAGTAVLCLLNYYILKVTLSYKILHIYYLKKIANASPVATIDSPKGNVVKKEELPEI
jgi:hypothetical protein